MEVTAGGGHEAYADPVPAVLAVAPELPVLQDVQEPGLQGRGELLHGVQEERPARGGLQKAHAGARVAEELLLEPVTRDGGAVDPHQRPSGHEALPVQLGGHGFLAAAGFAGDEDGHVRAGHLPDLFLQRAHAGAAPSQGQGRRGQGVVLQVGVLDLQLPLQAVQFLKGLGIGDGDRQIVRDHAQAVHGLRVLHLAAEDREDPQHAAPVQQRLAQEGADAFLPDPAGRGHPVHVRADIVHMIGGA